MELPIILLLLVLLELIAWAFPTFVSTLFVLGLGVALYGVSVAVIARRGTRDG